MRSGGVVRMHPSSVCIFNYMPFSIHALTHTHTYTRGTTVVHIHHVRWVQHLAALLELIWLLIIQSFPNCTLHCLCLEHSDAGEIHGRCTTASKIIALSSQTRCGFESFPKQFAQRIFKLNRSHSDTSIDFRLINSNQTGREVGNGKQIKWKEEY